MSGFPTKSQQRATGELLTSVAGEASTITISILEAIDSNHHPDQTFSLRVIRPSFKIPLLGRPIKITSTAEIIVGALVEAVTITSRTIWDVVEDLDLRAATTKYSNVQTGPPKVTHAVMLTATIQNPMVPKLPHRWQHS
jgi:hypothetical protein